MNRKAARQKTQGMMEQAEALSEVRRLGLASFLFGLLRPQDARAAALMPNSLTLTRTFGAKDVPLKEIDTVELGIGWFWGGLLIRTAFRKLTLSGLARDDAKQFAGELEAARVAWWRKMLAAQAEMLHSGHIRLAQMPDPPRYLTHSASRDLVRDMEGAVEPFGSKWPAAMSDNAEIQMLAAIRNFLKAPDHFRAQANKAFVAKELNRSRKFFDHVEAQPLTEEQRKAVVVDEDRNLVIAAAGSGKTSVIVAKAGWLVRRACRRPPELLLLAFARDARKEMETRVRDRLGREAAHDITVRTFHSLGLWIIGEAEGKRPTLAKAAEDEGTLVALLKSVIAELLKVREISEHLLSWFQRHFAPYRNKHDFRNWGEYYDYIRRHEIRSLNGEKVKSFEECEIANFLYLNGVPYEYERTYEHGTATASRRQYKPDFYLLDSGIYIEHFALNAKGDTPPFIDRDEYLREREWKLRLHASHGTVLIETFSHERDAGRLTANLEEKLRARNVTLSPVPPKDIFAVLKQQGRVDSFVQLVAAFLHHCKEARLSFHDMDRRAANSADRPRAKAFLTLFRRIFEGYQDRLSRSGEIDFHDMINQAAEHVESRRWRSPFSYVLVDEFQDISPGRARLLKALLEQSPTAQLFAVGDDWQAIYRFSGSDIAIMREFGERFGFHERLDLETTFRCSSHIAEVATEFVLDDPAHIRKSVHSTRQTNGPGVIVGRADKKSAALLPKALDRIARDAIKHEGPSTVLLLSRYRHLRPQNMPDLAKRYPGLRLSWKTVHGSKGLEADYVVVLGLCTGRYGFPSGITDDPLLDLVLAAPENHPNAEERRLFYVALTRAKRLAFLISEGEPPSPFVKELLDKKHVEVLGAPPERGVPCPRCIEGRLERRENARSGGIFYGCSNWPYCEQIQRPCPACREGVLVKSEGRLCCRDCGKLIKECPACDGWLEARMGKYGRFLGCSNYPACSYTRDIGRRR